MSRGLALLVLVALVGAARAQEKGPDGGKKGAQEKPPPGPLEIESGDALTWQEGDRTVLYFTGGVTLRRPDFQLKAARVLAWSRSGVGSTIDELYAEGNVSIRKETQTLHCEQIFVDLSKPEEPKGFVVDIRGEEFSKQYRELFYVRAREARIARRGMVFANDVSLSTCSYGVPHYHLAIDKATLVAHEGAGEARGDKWANIWPTGAWEVLVEDVYPELLGAPIFFLPALILSPALQDFPLRRLEGGHTSAFGYYVYSGWGARLKREDETGEWRPWADVELKADWRENRGGGYGLDFRYKWTTYEGYLDTYYLHDLGRDLSIGINEKFGPLIYDDRGKAHFFHRQNLDDHWRFELEAYYVSDRDLREEFFLKEFQEEKDPETAAYLRWLDGPMGAYAYERYRINDWQTVDEYLPKLHFSVFQVPIVKGAFSDLYLSQELDAARIRREFDHELGLSPVDVWRLDSVTELSLPWDMTYFQVAPFARQRLTYYVDTLDGDPELRSDTSAGARVSTQMHATWPDIAMEEVGLRGLRHVMEFEVRYASTLHHVLDTAELFPFDAVDQLGEFEEVEFGMHHRFKTRDATGKPFEFLSVGVEVEYYPNAQRDTTSLRVDDYLPPFNYILVSPRTDGTFPERHWSNVHYGLAFQPRNFFQAYGSGEYNPAAGYEEARQYGVTVWPWEKTYVSAGQVYVRGVTNAYTGSITTALTEKWAFSVQAQYDFKVNQFLTERLVVSRDFHDFLLEAVVERNTTTNDKRVYVTFVPKFLGAKGEHRSHMVHDAPPTAWYTNPEP